MTNHPINGNDQLKERRGLHGLPALIAQLLYWIWIFAFGVTTIAVGVYVGLQMHYRKVQKNDRLHHTEKKDPIED
ncbi:hypothetical protein JOC54_002776 [Alkalihalobacillus xiaoxiensis]|uniref:Uncharacterized protein n=1 Tax=Shouchella xiaoxiensis TaxID=766895 RepID=A0ABS2SVE7_9BACI|nr:hypothetical protein [Shouchella xiaoxiensis]MBM7839496.1 hypothetical protein [Shouchella xiaoxiensis]